jgi:magnesium-transporting ATPase (P-type)
VEKGRIIYAGIQKFVAFIMSVHIAEVVQIVACIIVGMPLMRTPLQILFLILVTDLPPSIALGLESGDSTILLAKPRPRDEPVVLGWMWLSICANGILLSAVILFVYVGALYHYTGAYLQSDILCPSMSGTNNSTMVDILNANPDHCTDQYDNMNDARTVAFIALVWSENVRAYAARSFDKPIWHNLCGNPNMQIAVLCAQVALYIAVLVPYFSTEILELRGAYIGWWGWLYALIGPVGTVVLCELFKLVTGCQMRRYERQKEKSMESDSESDNETSESDDHA